MKDYTDPDNRSELDKICLETIKNYCEDTVYFKDVNSRFIWNSMAHAKQFGVASAEELFGKSDFDFFPKDFAQAARETEMAIIASGQAILNIEEELRIDEDNSKYFLASKYPLFDENGQIIGTWGTTKDITEIKTLEKKLERSYEKMQMLARVDDLSGLYNRRYFYEKLEKLASLYEERNDGSTFSLIILDVDDMTYINDQYGQQNGDTVLRSIAEVMLGNTKKQDTCFRIGGDEFAAVLPDQDKMAALGVAKQIVTHVASNPIILEGKREKVTVSIGLVTYDPKENDLNEMLSTAERKVSKSKREGKNKVSF